MACIFCGSLLDLTTIEHIVNDSLVNCHYTLPKGTICKSCNNLFSKFENSVLSKSIFGMERARLGIITKKKKPAKAKPGDIEFEGDKDYRKNYLTAFGLKEEHMRDFNPETKTFKLTVPSFDKNEMSAAKFLLKMGFEALYKSQPMVFKKHDFSLLKDYLLNKDQRDWPFIMTDPDIYDFKSIPRFNDKYELTKNRCTLAYHELPSGDLLFRFTYGAVTTFINMSNRDIEWIKPFAVKDEIASIYPDAVKRRIRGRSDSGKTGGKLDEV